MYFRRYSIFNDTLVRTFSININAHRQNNKSNHYDCLGITPKASQSDVKSAYYKLSKKYHPDLNKGNLAAASKFRDITSAYEVLGNSKARKLYDRSLAVRGIEDYSQPDDIKEDYEHASFYRARYNPVEKKPSKVDSTTPHYNIDEWTKAHYSKRFYTEKDKKDEAKINVKENTEVNRQYHTASRVIILLIIMLFAFSITSPKVDYDVSSKEPSK